MSISVLLMTCENMHDNKRGNTGVLVGKGNSVQDSKVMSQHGVFVMTKACDSYRPTKEFFAHGMALS